jgi:hypothetical protein
VLARLQKLKLDILDSNNFDSLCKLFTVLKDGIAEMEKKIAAAASVDRPEEYQRLDEDFSLFLGAVETIKGKAKEVVQNEMRLMQERLQRLQSGADFF